MPGASKQALTIPDTVRYQAKPPEGSANRAPSPAGAGGRQGGAVTRD